MRDYSNPTFMKPLAPLVLPAVYDDVLSYEEWLSKVIHRLNEINEIINETIGDIDALVEKMVNNKTADLQSQINGLKNSLTSLQTQVDEGYEELDDKIDSTLVEAKAYADKAINDAIRSLGDIDGKINNAKAQAIETSEHYTDEKIASVNTTISALRLAINQDLARRLAAMNARIDDIIKEYPSLYDPATGFNEDMQTVIYNIYKALRTLGVMAMQYDDQELTAQAYDDMNLKAIDYDVRMFQILFRDLREMFNPFTGKLSSLRDVVGDLVRRLQWNAKTTSQADGYEATASEFDSSSFDAYRQDTDQYLTEPLVDTKNKGYRNWLFVGSGSSITVPDELIQGSSQFAVLNYDGDITYIDCEAGTYGEITITYNAGVFTITGTNLRAYVVTRVYDVSELDN